MAHVSLTAHERTEFGNGPTRRLRKAGFVPGVVYQPGGPSLALSLSDRDLRRAIAEGRTGVIDLAVGDAPARPVLLKDWQLHPVRLDVMHVDFVEVDLTQEIEAPVAITLRRRRGRRPRRRRPGPAAARGRRERAAGHPARPPRARRERSSQIGDSVTVGRPHRARRA